MLRCGVRSFPPQSYRLRFELDLLDIAITVFVEPGASRAAACSFDLAVFEVLGVTSEDEVSAEVPTLFGAQRGARAARH